MAANLTRADGRYTALDAHPLYEHKSAAGAVYRAVLRTEVCERLEWVSWRESGRGLFEIDGVPEGVLEHFSQRRAEIEQRAEQLVGAGTDGELSRERMQGIALATRRPKTQQLQGLDWRQRARARAAEHGFGQRELARLARRRPEPARVPAPDRVAGWLSGPGGLTEMHNTFARRHALAQIAGAFSQGITVAGLEQAVDQYLADASVHRLDGGAEREARFTTERLLACEIAIVNGARRRRDEATAVLAPELVARVIALHRPVLNDDQGGAIRAITAGGHGIDTVQALAGTGKTTLIGALAACYREAGWRVIGTAPTGRAARELRDSAGVAAGTMHALVSELDRAGGFARRTVLVIDEAGMAPTRLTAALLAHAERAGVKVIAVGDCGQLPSVQAGGWLAALTRRYPGPQLRDAIRQHDPAERHALKALHDGNPDVYLDHKQDEISVHATDAQAVEAITDQWDRARQEHGLQGAVMIARDNVTREALNRCARDRLKQAGAIAGRGTVIARREFSTGDRVIARRNDRGRDIDNGTLATITQIDERNHLMLLQTDHGDHRALDFAYVTRHVEHAYAITGHGAQGATVDWAGVIGRPQQFTHEWAYTALSRARTQTTLHLIAEHGSRDRDGPAAPSLEPADTLAALHRAMRRREAEPLAIDALPILSQPCAVDPARWQRSSAASRRAPGHVSPVDRSTIDRIRLQRTGPRLGL